MGVVISSMLGTVALIVAGVMTSIAASKADHCGDAKKINIITAACEFVVAIIMILILIFLL